LATVLHTATKGLFVQAFLLIFIISSTSEDSKADEIGTSAKKLSAYTEDFFIF
jgi:hypothetical protein